MADRGPQMRDAARAFAMVADFIGTVLIVTAIGYGLDWWRGSGFLFTLIGFGVGLVMGFVRFVREGMRMGKRSQ